jgi:transcriptional regulator with XRE-family HTH domain
MKNNKFNGEKLKDLRIMDGGRTLEEVAEKIGCDTSSVSNWERGEKQPSPRHLRKLAAFFKVPIRAFFLTVTMVICLSVSAQAWEGVAVHISDSNRMSIDECNDWHRARGWDGCGYNFVIQRDGTIDTARGFERVGAHVKGWNTRLLGVCFVGKRDATPAQLEAFRGLLHGLHIEALQVVPHRKFAAKECPADVWAQLKQSGGFNLAG